MYEIIIQIISHALVFVGGIVSASIVYLSIDHNEKKLRIKNGRLTKINHLQKANKRVTK